jgi:integrase
MPLRDTAARNAKPTAKPRKLSDDGGLHLLVQPNGSKLWRLSYRFAGKQKTLALGAYPIVSLADARDARDAARKLLARSVDPSVQRKIDRQIQQANSESSFRAVAEEVISKLECEGRVTILMKRWLLDFAFPAFGERPWRRSRHASFWRCCDRSKAAAFTKPPNGCAAPAAWCFVLRSRPAAPSVIRRLTSVAAEKMKMRRPHRVPLARQSLAILRQLREITGQCKWLFPSVRTILRPISENTLNGALRRLGYGSEAMSTHGFRAMAATRLNEMGRWNADAIERQLAHQEENAVRRAYTHRAEYWSERVVMMQLWADYLDELRKRGVVRTLTAKAS